MISVERDFDMSALHSYMEDEANKRIDEVVAFLHKKGVEFTTAARQKIYATNPYNNITYNLVSSVGFSIAKSGIVVESYFPLEATGAQGKAKGEALAESTALSLSGPDDIVLIMVAGEDYASYVEVNGRDVVTGSSDKFTQYVQQIWGAYQ